MEIADWRKLIDEIDSEMLQLLSKRVQYTIHIGDIKAVNGQAVYSPEREAIILERLILENSGPLTEEGVRRIFERIIDESRCIEKQHCKDMQREK